MAVNLSQHSSVTGAVLGADSAVVALSVAAGLVKAILVIVATPLVAQRIVLDNL